jgi:hypothetical protein
MKMIKATSKHEITKANILIEEAMRKVKMSECANSFVDEIFQACELAIENTSTKYDVTIDFPFDGWNFNNYYSRDEKMNIVMDAVEITAKKIAEYGYSYTVVRYTSKNTSKAGCIIIHW